MFKNIKKQHNINKGFSLVEMLIAIAIFMSVMTVAISALITIINANKAAQAIKSTTDSVTFALESISRDMRIGTDYQCLTPSGSPIIVGGGSVVKDCTNGSPTVRYIGPNGGVIYKFSTSTFSGYSSLTKTSCSSNFVTNCK